MYLELKEVFTHNLKGFDLKIPLNQLVVITGPSGSGKSSLALDTIAKAGKNFQSLLENLGTSLRLLTDIKAQFLSSIPPIIALSQGVRDWYPYKGVFEILNIHSFLSYLFSEFGEIKCPFCGSYNKFHNLTKVKKWFEGLPLGSKLYLLLPLPEKGEKTIEYFLSQGFTRYVIDGKEYDLAEEERPKDFREICLLLDRLVREEKTLPRLLEDIRVAHSINRGQLIFQLLEGERVSFNLGKSCRNCGGILSQNLIRCEKCRGFGYIQKQPCPECHGLKWNFSCLESKIFDKTIKEILELTLSDWCFFLENNFQEEIKSLIEIQKSIWERAKYLEIEYLKLKTPVFQLSIGERKLLEILLLFSIPFTGVLYILDEPTLGLDERLRGKLLKLIREILERGNSFLVVEHDPPFIKGADFVIELGPGAGERGGYLINTHRGKNFSIEYPSFKPLEESEREYLEISGPRGIYKIVLRGINLFIGSHRGEEVREFGNLAKEMEKQGFLILLTEELLEGNVDKFLIDYLGIWDCWKEILIQLPEVKAKGLKKRHFSFYTPEGVCQTCKGKEEDILCPTCLGKRLNYEVLNLSYRGFKLYEILDFTIEEAESLFSYHYKIKEIILWLKDLKLSYLRFSQVLKDLSGGEKFRLSLVKRLISREKFDFLFLFYPFQGLSLSDLRELYLFFRKLNQFGKTLILFEPHPLAKKLTDNIVN